MQEGKRTCEGSRNFAMMSHFALEGTQRHLLDCTIEYGSHWTDNRNRFVTVRQRDVGHVEDDTRKELGQGYVIGPLQFKLSAALVLTMFLEL